jgi:hypothetical protein
LPSLPWPRSRDFRWCVSISDLHVWSCACVRRLPYCLYSWRLLLCNRAMKLQRACQKWVQAQLVWRRILAPRGLHFMVSRGFCSSRVRDHCIVAPRGLCCTMAGRHKQSF